MGTRLDACRNSGVGRQAQERPGRLQIADCVRRRWREVWAGVKGCSRAGYLDGGKLSHDGTNFQETLVTIHVPKSCRTDHFIITINLDVIGRNI